MMDRRIMIGQKLVTGLPGTEVTEEFIQLVKEHKVGNVILFARNIASPAQLRNLCADLQELIQKETGIPAFITIDQEGGITSRLGAPATVIPGAMGTAATGKPEYAFEAGRITGEELLACGVNFDLAPDMDVNSNPLNPVIGARSYGDQPEKVAEFGIQMMKGLGAGGVLSCIKHFPGHGDTAVDSHLGLPCIDKSMEELDRCELLPFKKAIEEGAPAVMTTHILFPQIETNNVPATMSPTILQGILREKFGFKGLILSDCMMMDAIAQHYGTVKGTCAAAMAGVDMIFICHSNPLTAEACTELDKLLPDDMLQESFDRIMAAKKCIPEEIPPFANVGCEEHVKKAAEMFRASITFAGGPTVELPSLGNKPLFVGCAPFQTTQANNPEENGMSISHVLSNALGGAAYPCVPTPDEAERAKVVDMAKEHTSVVISTFNAHLRNEQRKLVEALCELDIPVICVAMRNPYDLSGLTGKAWCLAAYDYTADAIHAIRDILAGKLQCTGTCPVQL